MSWYQKFPCRIICWLIAFFCWYQTFVAAHLGFVSTLNPLWHTVILLFWNVIFSLTISSLLAAGLTEATPVPEKYRVPNRFLSVPYGDRDEDFFQALSDYADAHPELSFQYVESDNGVVFPRHCDACQVFKPLRTHHCRACRKCIPRMDHHCPVIGACVHFHNHKFFLLFLFWASIVCLYATVFISLSMYHIVTSLNLRHLNELQDGIPILIVLSGLTNAIICGLALLAFQVYLWLMLMRNETSLESHEDDADPSFDLGRLANIQSIFGNDWRLWALPIPTTTGDGFTFPEKMQNITDDE